jgi:F0F1-type ATP synthase membrane subunit b/b'
MAEIQLDKVKLALSRMDDTYWSGIANRSSVLSNQSQRLAAEITDAFTKLTVAQIQIIEAKYNGYKLLAENKKKAAITGIVKENKDRISQLTQEKHQAVTALSTMIAEFSTMIKEAGTLGESSPATPPQGGDGH